MGIFSRITGRLSQKANAALDRATDPAKEIDQAITELEEQRKKALAELVAYKANAKLMDAELEKQRAKTAEWENRAMAAIKAGDDELAKRALREKKACESEIEKITRDRNEATGYAVQLNKSRKEFENKLALFKMRKGTLATQIAAARSAGGDAFGNDTSVWDRFAEAEDKIDRAAVQSEVDAAMRGEDDLERNFDLQLTAAAGADALSAASGDDAFARLKQKVEAERAKKALTAGASREPSAQAGAGDGGADGAGARGTTGKRGQ